MWQFIEINARFIFGKQMIYNYTVFVATIRNNCERSRVIMSDERGERIRIIAMRYSTERKFFRVFRNNEILVILGSEMVRRNESVCKSEMF